MVLSYPWDISYYKKCLVPKNFHYQTLSSKTVFSLILELLGKLIGIEPLVISAPWFVSYYNTCLETPKFHYQTFSTKIALKPVSILMMTSVTTKLAPSP